MNPKYRSYIIAGAIILIVLIIGGITWFFFATSHSSATNGAMASSTNPLNGGTSKTAANIPNTTAPATKYADHGQYYDIDLQYPSETPLSTTIGATANTNAIQAFKTFTTSTADEFKKNGDFDNLTPQDVAMQGLDQGQKYSLSDSYDFYSSPGTISYVFSMYSDTLGAHPNTSSKSFTFDAKTGQQLAISDLFVPNSQYLNTLSTLTRASLNQQLGPDADSDMLDPGTTPDVTNFQTFALDGSNLVIFFDPYQVAAYAAGTQTVKIPLSQLSSILKTQYQ